MLPKTARVVSSRDPNPLSTAACSFARRGTSSRERYLAPDEKVGHIRLVPTWLALARVAPPATPSQDRIDVSGHDSTSPLIGTARYG